MKKLLLGLGTLAAVAAPVATVIACGDKAEDKNKAPSKEEQNQEANDIIKQYGVALQQEDKKAKAFEALVEKDKADKALKLVKEIEADLKIPFTVTDKDGGDGDIKWQSGHVGIDTSKLKAGDVIEFSSSPAGTFTEDIHGLISTLASSGNNFARVIKIDGDKLTLVDKDLKTFVFKDVIGTNHYDGKEFSIVDSAHIEFNDPHEGDQTWDPKNPNWLKTYSIKISRIGKVVR